MYDIENILNMFKTLCNMSISVFWYDVRTKFHALHMLHRIFKKNVRSCVVSCLDDVCEKRVVSAYIISSC